MSTANHGGSAMRVNVIGLGYVGVVAAAGLAKAGHQVLGVDIDREKVDGFSRGDVPIYEPGLAELLRETLENGLLELKHVDGVSQLSGDVTMIAAGTPPLQSGAADLSQVQSALIWVIAKQPDGGVIVMKSTVPPGTGLRMGQTVLHGSPFTYVSNPEFLREGQAVFDWFNPDRIVVGANDDRSRDLMTELYSGIDAPHMCTDVTSAEMIKYASNAFLATRVSFINEVATLCDKVGATIDAVSEGLALDPRIGSNFMRAGVGYGGSCFPKDVRALDQLALANNQQFELLRSVITVNNRQRLLPLYTLRDRLGDLFGKRIGVLGLAFKPNTDDVREAPALDLIRVMAEEGAEIVAFDPKASETAAKVLPLSVGYADSPSACADGAQAVVVMTEWQDIVSADWTKIADLMAPPRLLFDGRNALDPAAMRALGFVYRGVGRGIGEGWMP
jgi:UDPglucose 6-dehydrogenase